MKVCRIIQISWLLVIATLLIVQGPSSYQSVEKLWAQDKGYYYYNQPSYYRHHYYPYLRYRTTPRVHYKIETTITIDDSSEEKISKVYLNRRRVDRNYEKIPGRKGHYYYLLSPGRHRITWTVTENRNTKHYARKFTIDPKAQSVHILLDGEEFTIK
jgi:hypothetical protein